jgi:uncharacterized protein with HEPN domain
VIDPPIRFRLEDIAEYARISLDLLGDSSATEVEADMKTHFALIRAVQVVGEAAAKIPDTYRTDHAQIPWRRAINMRNILVHAYRQIDLTIVVMSVREDFPPLIADIERLLGEDNT